MQPPKNAPLQERPVNKEVSDEQIVALRRQTDKGAHSPRASGIAFARAVLALAPVAGGVPAKYDDTLLPFLALMRRELHANSSKGDRPGWLTMSKEVGLLEIYWHAAKL